MEASRPALSNCKGNRKDNDSRILQAPLGGLQATVARAVIRISARVREKALLKCLGFGTGREPEREGVPVIILLVIATTWGYIYNLTTIYPISKWGGSAAAVWMSNVSYSVTLISLSIYYDHPS